LIARVLAARKPACPRAPTPRDRQRWEALRAQYLAAKDAQRAYESELRNRYGWGDPSWRSWITRTERGRLERLEARMGRCGDPMIELLVCVSPRGHAWRSGAPYWWIVEKLDWEDAVRPEREPMSAVVPAPYGQREGLREPAQRIRDRFIWEDAVGHAGRRRWLAVPDWERYLVPGDARYVPKVVRPQMPDVVARAAAAGMPPGTEYVGSGMTGVVFCDRDTAYKVSRATEPISHQLFEEEAEWLAAAETVPDAAPHVARIHRFDPENLVIVRDCPHPDHDQSLWRWESRLHDLHAEIERAMLPAGWTAPEFKPDSYVLTARGPVLVDASMPSRIGAVLAAYVEAVASGARPLWTDQQPSDLAFYVRREVGQTLTRAEADYLLALLDRRWPGAGKW
jgi:hypothetical protein